MLYRMRVYGCVAAQRMTKKAPPYLRYNGALNLDCALAGPPGRTIPQTAAAAATVGIGSRLHKDVPFAYAVSILVAANVPPAMVKLGHNSLALGRCGDRNASVDLSLLLQCLFGSKSW